MQDRIENVVGKYWIRVHGVNYGCSEMHSWVFPNCSKRGSVSQKDIFA